MKTTRGPEQNLIACDTLKERYYIGNNKANISFVDSGTGKVNWSYLLKEDLATTPTAATNGMVYAVGRRGTIVALDSKTQSEAWKQKIEGGSWTPPAVGNDGTLYVASEESGIYSLDGKTGKEKWHFAESGHAPSTPAIDEKGSVFFGNKAGLITALDESGEKKWDKKTYGQAYDSPPILAPGATLVALSENGDQMISQHIERCFTVYGLDKESGDEKWRYNTGTIRCAPLLLEDGTLLIGGYNGKLVALDSSNGKEKWKIDTGSAIEDLTMSSDGIAYLITSGWPSEIGKTNLVCVDLKEKKELWSAPAGDRYVSLQAGPDQNIYATDFDSTLHSLKNETYLETKRAVENPEIKDEEAKTITVDNERGSINIDGISLMMHDDAF